MTNCTKEELEFLAQKGRKIRGSFCGGEVTSDGGILLLREVEKRTSLLEKISACIEDKRARCKVVHSISSMVKQRVFGIALGYEDLNDHKTLRQDTVLQLAAGREESLASSSTLCRLENGTDRATMVAMHKVIVEHFIESFQEAPKELILDFDATDDRVHGEQKERFFHGYYGDYCFLPLYVFCGDQLLVSYLRPSNIDGAKHAWAILSLLVKRFRQTWPNVKIIFRGDSGFCRHHMLTWCERHGVDYIIGIARNKVLEKALDPAMVQAKGFYEATGKKQRFFREFTYQAGTWSTERRVIGKAEYHSQGANPRFIITTLPGDPRALYDTIYCARGEMENRIKEQQLSLFADRTSCHEWWPNQFRLVLSSLAYILVAYFTERER